MPLMEGLEVIRSPIHGYGVIATRPYREGDRVLYGDGILYREGDDFDDTYSLILPGYELEPDGSEGPPLFWDLTCQSRWINHACDPNTVVDTGFDEATKKVSAWWVALRDIAPGEELTYDYAYAAEVAEPCACGSPHCRGVIVDADDIDELAPELKKLVKPQRG
jgi:hypothetical protein